MAFVKNLCSILSFARKTTRPPAKQLQPQLQIIQRQIRRTSKETKSRKARMKAKETNRRKEIKNAREKKRKARENNMRKARRTKRRKWRPHPY